ncbi:MAG: GerW family sporulation protein [Lachnospiraceae bacterium]|nr:GerW family sporulation protein [Lachnospiraceae bacterium]MBP5472070.1 GerW family sporulation protein [Lachnospiraceae bacterium]
MADNERKEVVDSLLQGMDTILSSKTVVGNPIVVGDTTLIPLVDVSFGLAAGSGHESRNYNKNSSGGGMGGKVSPNAVIVIKDGSTRLLSVKNQDTITKIMDMVPEVVHRLSKDKNGGPEDDALKEKAFPEDDL